jgi:hypothetical protein
MFRLTAFVALGVALLLAFAGGGESWTWPGETVTSAAAPCPDDTTGRQDLGPAAMASEPCGHFCSGTKPVTTGVLAGLLPPRRGDAFEALRFLSWDASFASLAPVPLPDPPRTGA